MVTLRDYKASGINASNILAWKHHTNNNKAVLEPRV